METNHSYDMCRLCLFRNNNLIDIFEVNAVHGFVVAEVISNLLSLQVSEDDGYPRVVCESCLEKLNEFKMFKEVCYTLKATYDNLFFHRPASSENQVVSIEMPVKLEPVEEESNEPEFSRDVAALEDNTGTAMELECHESIANLKEEPISRVWSGGLLTGRQGSCQLSQLENSQLDGSCYESSSSDAEEAAIVERNSYCKTEKKVEVSESLSRHSLMEDSNSLASSSRNGAVAITLSDGLKSEECSSDGLWAGSVRMPKEGSEADVLQSRNRSKIRVKEKSVPCEQCDRKFTSEAFLRRHILCYHSGEKVYRCHICNKTFENRHRLYSHSLSHRTPPNYHCSECGEDFWFKAQFTKHLSVHEVTPFLCSHCGVDLKSKGLLDRHYTVHDGEVDWGCVTCGEKYEKWCDLLAHRRTHYVEGLFICDTCGVEYAMKRELLRHIYLHTRPHACPTCNKTFPTKSEMRVHSYRHSKVKAYRCNICRKRFNQPGSLYRHLKIHSEERPYTCNLCSYRGKTMSLLKSHQVKHQTSKPYKCGFCDAAFLKKYYKRRHEKKWHKNKKAK